MQFKNPQLPTPQRLIPHFQKTADPISGPSMLCSNQREKLLARMLSFKVLP